MTSTINTRALAFAAVAVGATLSAICSFLVAIAPDATRTVTGWFFHADASGLRWSVTWTSFCVRLLGSGLLAGLVVGGVAVLYNRAVGRSGRTERE